MELMEQWNYPTAGEVANALRRVDRKDVTLSQTDHQVSLGRRYILYSNKTIAGRCEFDSLSAANAAGSLIR